MSTGPTFQKFLQRSQQSGIQDGQRLPTAARSPDPPEDSGRRTLGRLGEFALAGADGVARKACRRGDRGNPASPQLRGFRGSPLSAHTFVHADHEQPILLTDLRDDVL